MTDLILRHVQGRMLLCDENGFILPHQLSTVLESSATDLTTLTVTFHVGNHGVPIAVDYADEAEREVVDDEEFGDRLREALSNWNVRHGFSPTVK